MPRKRGMYGQGSIYLRKGSWWCDYSSSGVRYREPCETRGREEALNFLRRKEGKLASGEMIAPDRVRVRDLLQLLLEDYYGDMAKFIETQAGKSEFLFARGSNPIKDFRESWSLACARAGVPGLLFHDLRRTAVRNLRRAGVAESVIMKITGHRTRGVFERYNITDQTDHAGSRPNSGRVPGKGTGRKIGTNNVTKTGKDTLTETGKFFVMNGAERGT